MSEAKRDQPGAVVLGTVFRNAYIGDIEKHDNVPVTLDQWGVHGTVNINGWREPVMRLNEWDYSFDAPDSVCPIAARQRYVDAALWRASNGIVSNDEKPELWACKERVEVMSTIAEMHPQMHRIDKRRAKRKGRTKNVYDTTIYEQ